MKSTGFIEGFLETARSKPQASALELIDEDAGGRREWSYGQMLEQIEQYRSGFLGLDIEPGEAVMLQLPSGPELIACLYALASIQAIFAPVSPHLTSHELAALLDDLRPVAIVSDPESLERWEALKSTRSQIRCVVSPDKLQGAGSPLEPPVGNPIVSCHYTYKGLGNPLGTLHRYDDYGSCIHAMTSTFDDARDATHLVGLPIYPIYGLSTGVLGPLATGCRVLITHRIFETGLIDVLERHQVAFACMVPMLLKKLAQNARRLADQGRAPRLHPGLQIISGGSYLNAEIAASIKATLGVSVFQGYGLTETLIVSATCRKHDKPGSLGVPLRDDIELAIVDSSGHPVPDTRAGEIAVRGASVMAGYYNNPAATARFLRDGWFHTGDLGFKDSDGFLHFVGRRCPIAKVASQMADLIEVEDVIRTIPAIADVRVTVAVRPEIGEALAASVIVREGFTLTERDLKRTCKQLLSPHKTPREFRFVNASAGGGQH
jgi:long-chain acyl-CoA synthetase